jgi:branched-chain amino acid transport system ATP-binding protein
MISASPNGASRSAAAPTAASGPETAPLLVMRSVQMSFGGLMALNNFNLTLAEGELHGLIGPNGAGKTTVFNLLTGFYESTEGEISFAGRDLRGLTPQAINRRGIARTFQNIRLFDDMSVLDNVLVPLQGRSGLAWWQAVLRTPGFRREEKACRERAGELLTRLELAPYAQMPAGRLPYGQQRRLEIARALAAGPRLLLLDEPAAGLNPHESAALLGLLQELRRDYRLTILLIEHNMKFVMHICERLTVLEHGLTIAQGPPEAVRTDPRVIRAYLGEAAGA